MPQEVISIQPLGQRLPFPPGFHPIRGWYVCPRYLVLIDGVHFRSGFRTEAEFMASPHVLPDLKKRWSAQRAAGLFAAWLHQ